MRCAGMITAAGLRGWMSTLDYRALYFDPSVDGVYRSRGTRIYVFWHEYILVPLYIRGNCNLTMLLSRHRDADILASVAHFMGHECVRGSTARGGAAAMIELAQRARHARRHHARRPARAAAPARRRADLSCLSAGAAHRTLGLRIRPAVASQELGPFRRPPALVTGALDRRARGAHSARSRPARHGAASASHRTTVERLDGGVGSLGRQRRTAHGLRTRSTPRPRPRRRRRIRRHKTGIGWGGTP